MKTFLLFIVSFLLGFSHASAQWIDKPDPLFGNSILWSVQVLDGNNVWAVAYSNNEVVKTTNGGQTWTVLPVTDPDFAGYGIESITVIDVKTAWLTASTSIPPIKTRIYKTTDGGLTWQHQVTAYPGPSPDGHWAFANHFFDANNGVNFGEKITQVSGTQIYTSNIEILNTTDGGTTWNVVPAANLPVSVQGEGVNYRSFTVVGNSMWFMTTEGKIYKTVNKGQSWSRLDPGLPAPAGIIINSIAFADTDNGLVANAGMLKRTTDGGATWTTVNTTGQWNGNEIVHVPGTAATFISAGRYPGNAGSYISHDFGVTWTALETTNQHFDIQFINPTTGWSGGIGRMFEFNGTALGTPKEICNANSYFIQPNPSQGVFSISPATAKPFTLQVYELCGKQVMQQEGNRFGKNDLDLSGQKKGVYLLHILNEKQHIIEKIVLQ